MSWKSKLDTGFHGSPSWATTTAPVKECCLYLNLSTFSLRETSLEKSSPEQRYRVCVHHFFPSPDSSQVVVDVDVSVVVVEHRKNGLTKSAGRQIETFSTMTSTLRRHLTTRREIKTFWRRLKIRRRSDFLLQFIVLKTVSIDEDIRCRPA